MPPRKRQRLTPSASAKASPEAEGLTPVPSSPAPRSTRSGAHHLAIPATSPEDSAALSSSTSPEPSSPWTPDAWTPAQETALFKALIRHKPTGMNKHFQMLSVASYVHSHHQPTFSATSIREKPRTADEKEYPAHLRIPGIWEKLSGLYDLAALDERADAYAFGADPDSGPFEEFRLPGEPTKHGPGETTSTGPNKPPSAAPMMMPGQTERTDTDDEAYFASLVWARRFPNPELESDMEASSPEREVLPLRRGPDGSVETVASTRGVVAPVRNRKSDTRPGGIIAGSAARRKSFRRDVSTKGSGTPATDVDATGEDKDMPTAEDGGGYDDNDGDEGGAGEETDGEQDEIDDDEDELGDSSNFAAARSTRSSARVRRR